MSLEHLVSIENYVPSIYQGVKEIDALIKSEDYLFDILVSIVDKEYARMFIQTSDIVGVERFENILQITANPSIESLQFRKERLLTRCNSTLPYSTIWLRIYLNAVLGQSNYDLKVDYKNLIITLYGYLLDYSWAREVGNTIRDIKPANMIFINIPTLIESIELQKWVDDNTWNSDIWNDENIWTEFNVIPKENLSNYQKLPEGHIDTQKILKEIAGVRLNQNTIINNTDISLQNGTIYVEFSVPEDIKLLEYVEVMGSNQSTLLFTPCYIDTPSGTKLVIRITCYEKREN